MKKLYFVFLFSASLALSGQTAYKPADIPRASTASPTSEVTAVSEDGFSTGGGEGFIALYNLPSGPATVQIISLTGKVVKTLHINAPSSTEKVDLENFPAGIYLVNVQNKSGFQAVRKAYLR